ncbi:hypothetical protein AM593_09327, partial [Mytilus galloprovincialis]
MLHFNINLFCRPDREGKSKYSMSNFQGNIFEKKWQAKISEWQDKKEKLREEGKPIFEKPTEAQPKLSKGSVRWSTVEIPPEKAFPRSSQIIRKHHSAPNQPLTNESHPNISSGATRAKSLPHQSYRSRTSQQQPKPSNASFGPSNSHMARKQSPKMVSSDPLYATISQEMLDSAAQLYRKQLEGDQHASRAAKISPEGPSDLKSSSSSQQSVRNLYATVTRQSGERLQHQPPQAPPQPPTPPLPPKSWDMLAAHPSIYQSMKDHYARLQMEAIASAEQLG